MQKLKFTVDAKLLRELGERLVGRPYVALAELIKNSYDADAKHVEITFEGDTIRVSDDGRGMDSSAFKNRWMRIGTTNKVSEIQSPGLQRALTGSKGVGRLSAQLIASKLEIRSVAVADPKSTWEQASPKLVGGIKAVVDWDAAVEVEDLTNVEVQVDTLGRNTTFANKSPHGTELILSGLHSQWEEEDFTRLAQQIWALQPPFETGTQSDFKITLNTQYASIQSSFKTQMNALFKQSVADITGRLLEPDEDLPKNAPRITLIGSSRFGDLSGDASAPDYDTEETDSYSPTRYCLVKVKLRQSDLHQYLLEIPDCQLDRASFDVKIFKLKGRQKDGLTVQDARDYLQQFGGVAIYDDGFQLPYYGPEQDWLRLDSDHARRLSRSQYLPEELQAKNAMQKLPTNKNVFGSVQISTGHEARVAEASKRRRSDALTIQITRDRLVDNKARRQLAKMVRVGLDLYARAEATSQARPDSTTPVTKPDPVGASSEAIRAIEEAKSELTPTAYESIRSAVQQLASTAREIEEQRTSAAVLLGTLATSGMLTLAYDHEVAKQRGYAQATARKLEQLAARVSGNDKVVLEESAHGMAGLADRLGQIRSWFAHLLDEESRTEIGLYRAAVVLSDVIRNVSILMRGVQVATDEVPDNLFLPAGSYAGWSAMFQNLLINAAKATLDTSDRRISVSGAESPNGARLIFQNTGVAVDLQTADEFFRPFRRDDRSTERSIALGLGGSGLGLTIVRTIATEFGSRVSFVAPNPGWATALELSWKAG